MKACIHCGVPKVLDEFYTHSGMADGRLGTCKECCKTSSRQRRGVKLEEIRAYDRQRGNTPEAVAYRRDHPPSLAARLRASNKWLEKNEHKKRANTAVSNALKVGTLTRLPCEVCGVVQAEAHHDDYDEPLEVRWLCGTHHKEHHKRERELKRHLILT